MFLWINFFFIFSSWLEIKKKKRNKETNLLASGLVSFDLISFSFKKEDEIIFKYLKSHHHRTFKNEDE
jgi:hypothetical protein